MTKGVNIRILQLPGATRTLSNSLAGGSFTVRERSCGAISTSMGIISLVFCMIAEHRKESIFWSKMPGRIQQLTSYYTDIYWDTRISSATSFLGQPVH